jgi:polysaccharide export outer membrane protein
VCASAVQHAVLLGLLLGAAGTTGCAHPTVKRTVLPSSVVSQVQERLDPQLLQHLMGDREGEAYRVGPGDSLLVAIYGHPELSLATYAGSAAPGGRPAGHVVDNDGTIQFPLIGSVKVAGKTTEQLRKFLETQLAVYVRDPKVTLQLLFNGSIRYYLVGQFLQPGLKYSDRPLRLLEAMSLGGSIQLERASLRSAYLVRDGKKLPINFRRLMRDGDLSQNIAMRPGDLIMVPDNATEQAFVFAGGNNGVARGGPVNFRNGQMTIMQALASTGYGYRDRSLGRLSSTRVIRSEGERGELFVIDANKIIKGEAADFELVPGDVVFVPARAITTWNQALEQLLPTLQTVGGLLSPWVQIRFLQDSYRNQQRQEAADAK